MTKRHLKARVAPKSWPNVLRKNTKYVSKPKPGTHKLEFSLTLGSIIKDLGLAKTTREIKKILNDKEILVDGRRVKERNFSIGFMDVVSIKDIGNYRLTINESGFLKLIELKVSTNIKLTKIINKTMYRGSRLQLNLIDSRNVLVKENKYNVGDSLVIELPSQKITEHLPLKEGSFILLIGGKHIGDKGVIEKISGKNIVYKNKDNNSFETLKDYAFVFKEDFVN